MNLSYDYSLSIGFRFLTPVLKQRLTSLKDPSFKPPVDFMQLIIDEDPNGTGRSIEYHAKAQAFFPRASLFTTASTVFKCLYDLAIHPEYIEPLRKEAMALSNGRKGRSNLAKHVKLDSFVREVQRFFMLTPCKQLSYLTLDIWIGKSRLGYHLIIYSWRDSKSFETP